MGRMGNTVPGPAGRRGFRGIMSQMLRVAGGRRRLLFVIALLCVVAVGQAASLAAAQHSHADSPGHCCWLCHIGPLPFLQAPPAACAPTFTAARLEPPREFDSVYEPHVAAGSSRAPPA